MIVRLKAIESRENIFCYLSSYLRSRPASHHHHHHPPPKPLYHPQAINHRILESLHPLPESLRHQVVRKPLNHQVLESLRGPLGTEASSRYRSCCAFGSSWSGRTALIIELFIQMQLIVSESRQPLSRQSASLISLDDGYAQPSLRRLSTSLIVDESIIRQDA